MRSSSTAEAIPSSEASCSRLSGFFDVLDGAVARATGRTSQRGAFLDSTLDRVSEVVVFLGILVGGYVSPFLVLVALSLSLLVSYTRAKGDALGVNLAGIGVGERSERLIVLIVTSLLGIVGIGVLVVAAARAHHLRPEDGQGEQGAGTGPEARLSRARYHPVLTSRAIRSCCVSRTWP